MPTRSSCASSRFSKPLFREAHKKTIRIPEDDPGAVMALIRWLYRGTYKFDGSLLQNSTMRARKVTGRQCPDLLGCLFHLEAPVVASKYDSQDLFARARQEYLKAQPVLFSLKLLRLWRAYFTTGLDESQALGVSQIGKTHLRGIIAYLIGDHRAELTSTIAEFPSLGVSLLEACVGRNSVLEPTYLLSK